MKRLSILAAFAVLTIAACASAGREYQMSEKTAERLAEFERTGETVRCLSSSSTTDITPIDERHFLVRVGAGRYYLNELSSSCYGAGRAGNRLQYEIYGGQLCRNQIIHVVDNSGGFHVGTCALGDFEKVEKVEKVQAE